MTDFGGRKSSIRFSQSVGVERERELTINSSSARQKMFGSGVYEFETASKCSVLAFVDKTVKTFCINALL